MKKIFDLFVSLGTDFENKFEKKIKKYGYKIHPVRYTLEGFISS